MTSAGLAADGSPAAENAVAVMREWGADIAGHVSRPLTAELFYETDCFLVMSPAHRQVLLTAGADESRVFLLGGGIPDPFGGPIEVYRATRDRLEEALTARLDEQEESHGEI